MAIERWECLKLSTTRMARPLKEWQIGTDTDIWWWGVVKVKDVEAREVKVRYTSAILTGIISYTVIC